jgi:hypothetical protein
VIRWRQRSPPYGCPRYAQCGNASNSPRPDYESRSDSERNDSRPLILVVPLSLLSLPIDRGRRSIVRLRPGPFWATTRFRPIRQPFLVRALAFHRRLASRFATLMSSSIAGQCTPRPPPISRQERRSSAVACARRGYQATGAAMVRPSASSTDKASSLTSTPVAMGTRGSTVEELIPTLQQLLSVLLAKPPDPVDFLPAEAAATLQAQGIEPELRLGVVAFE